MARSVEITLLKKKVVTDAIKAHRVSYLKRKITGEIKSVLGNEFFRAGQLGIKATKVAEVFLYDYKNEPLCEIEGIRYQIYRTYEKESDYIELYLSEDIQDESQGV